MGSTDLWPGLRFQESGEGRARGEGLCQPLAGSQEKAEVRDGASGCETRESSVHSTVVCVCGFICDNGISLQLE